MDDTNFEDIDSTTNVVEDTENQADDTSLEQETDTTDEEKAKLAELNKKLFERAKKAETELKALKAKGEPQKPINNSPVELAEELKLIAKGLSDEEIEQAKIIAKGTGTNLSEALKSSLFGAFQKELKETQRKEQAKLGATRGSGQTESKKDFRSGLTREEHMALWKETQA